MKKYLGIIIGLALLALVAVGLLSRDQVVSNPNAFKRVDTVEVKGKATKEFVSLCANPRVLEILRAKHKVVPTCVQATSAETVAKNAGEGGQDFLVPASDLMASTYPGKALQVQPAFSSPIIGFTRSSHAASLVEKGLATKQSDGSLLLPFAKLAELVAKKATWKSVGVNEYGPVKVRGTGLESTTSGQALLHLLVAAFNNDEPVTLETVEALTVKVKPIVDRLGQLPKTTNDLLNICLSTGCTDLNVGLESTYLRIVRDFEQGDENAKKSAEAMKKNLALLYPQPAAWGHHTMIILTENGRRFLTALSDPEIQAIAWQDHGLRTPGQGIRMDAKSAPVPGVAVSIGAAVTQPTAEANKAFINAVLGKK
jgi:tetrahydromethanopterin S-methyltransferase subunit B